MDSPQTLKLLIKLEVSDDGNGLDYETRSKITSGETVGVGLRGMQERARQLGGSVEIRSNGKGTTVTVTVPFEESERSVATSTSDGRREPTRIAREARGDLSDRTVVRVLTRDEPDEVRKA